MILSQEVIFQRKFKLKAKKILYSIDVDIICEEVGSQMIIKAQGPVRFGPFSKEIYIQTTYENDEKLHWKTHEFRFKDSSSIHNYELKEKNIFLRSSKNSQAQKILLIEKPWWDPLSLLLQINYDFKNNCLSPSYCFLANEKFSEIVRREDRSGVYFEKKGKRQFSLVRSKKGTTIIRIDKVKAQAELVEILGS